MTVTINPVNDPPVANDGTLTTHEDQAAAASLSASDPDGDTLTYSIVTNGGRGAVTITDPETGSYIYTPGPNENGVDQFTFKVNDGTVDSNTATVTVTINPVNDPPVADAGPDQAVDEETIVTLDGSNSFDPDDSIASYQWTQISGPTVDLNDADTSTPSFLAPAVSSPTILSFQLTVTDSGALSDIDEVTVTINNTP